MTKVRKLRAKKVEDLGDLVFSQIHNSKPFAYNGETGVDLNSNIGGLEREVGRFAFTKQVDLRRYFKKPPEIEEFDGDVTLSSLAKRMFYDNFKENINQKARAIENRRGIEIKGVLMNLIEIGYHRVDLLSRIAVSTSGTLRLGVAYLA